MVVRRQPDRPGRLARLAPGSAATLGVWVALAALAGGCESESAKRAPTDPLKPSEAVSGGRGNRDIVIANRTADLATYPCMERCHADLPPDPTPGELTEFHTTIDLAHGSAAEACGFCHRSDNLDTLRLISGEVVTFDRSERICGQCHGEIHEDWHRGIHGLDTGTWNGATTRRTCTACHDPHAPGRIVYEALPPPTEAGGGPAYGRYSRGGGAHVSAEEGGHGHE